jgi:hypothetical protein
MADVLHRRKLVLYDRYQVGWFDANMEPCAFIFAAGLAICSLASPSVHMSMSTCPCFDTHTHVQTRDSWLQHQSPLPPNTALTQQLLCLQTAIISMSLVLIISFWWVCNHTRKESLLVLPHVGILFTSTPYLGGSSSEMLDWAHVGPLIINEVSGSEYVLNMLAFI